MKNHLEDDIQTSIITALRLLYPKSISAHVPNGGKRNVREAIRFKRQGVLSGFADIIFLHKGECIFFEVKAPKGVLSPTQIEFKDKVITQGFIYHVVHSVEETLNIIVDLNLNK